MASLLPPVEREPGRDPSWELVANLKAGVSVEESFRRLYRDFQPLVQRFFLGKGCSVPESEDLVQNTFVHVFKGIQDFRWESSFKTWLIKVARNIWLNELRRRSTAKRGAAEVPLDDPELGEEIGLPAVEADALVNQMMREEQRQTLLGELHSLPPQMRRCVNLRLLQDMPYRQIATTMGVSIQTVRSQLFQARKRLKERLEGVEPHV